jgi:hypothetical protein
MTLAASIFADRRGAHATDLDRSTRYHLTQREQNRNILFAAFSHPGDTAMSEAPALSDTSRYEQACDQAIAMCDGNLRSTIKALIMANEFLETELHELQSAISCGCAPPGSSRSDAA